MKNKTLSRFHHDIKMYYKYQADNNEKEKINNKYLEFDKYLLSRETNEFFVEAIIFDHVISGNDHLCNYEGRDLLTLYCYFNSIYSKLASYKEDGIKFIRKQFKEVIKPDSFDGIYDFRFRNEKKRCLLDVINGKYTLKDDEIIFFENNFDKEDMEIRKLIFDVLVGYYKVFDCVMRLYSCNTHRSEQGVV